MKELERSLGLASVVAISISSMLGSGIFVLPGLAAAKTGPSVWVAYLLAGLCVLPAATCKAELATAMPTSGGTYVYLERIFGPFLGTIAGVALWLSMLLKGAFALLGFGAYLLVMGDVPLVPTALLFLVGIVMLNVFGIKHVSRAQMGVVSAALAGLVALVIAGFLRLEPTLLRQDELQHGVGGLLAAAGFVFVSYNGVTKVAAIAEEIRDPGRNLPLGILISLVLMMCLYALVAFVLVGNVPVSELGTDLRPVHTLAERLGGPWAGTAAAVIGVFAMTSMANAGLLASSRFPFAMSRERLLPGLFARLHDRLRTPIASIILTGGVMGIAIAFLDVERLAKLASAIVIMLFVSVNTAVIIFRESRPTWYQPKYRSPFYPWLQLAGVATGLALLGMLGPLVLAAAAAVTIPGALLYVLYGRRQAVRLGVLGQRGRRADLLRDATHPVPVELQDALHGEAGVVVALFGEERSPEVMVDVGAALAERRRIHVLSLTEVPEQTAIDAVIEEEASIQSLRRRVGAMAEQTGADIEFHAVVSRDLARTVHAVTSRVHCDWLVMQWGGESRRSVLPYNPIGWLLNHLGSNLALYKDAGVRYVREILVFPEPGPHDALVVGTADQLATTWGARLTLVRFVPNGAPDASLQTERAYLEQLAALCPAWTRSHVLRGKDQVSAMAELSAAHDLLVMGAEDATVWRMLLGTRHERLTRRAACSVLTVKTPRVRTHEAFERRRSIEPGVPNPVLAHLDRRVLGARLEVSRKDALFRHVACQLAEALPEATAERIEDALWKRERSQSTSVGQGVALPHATLPELRHSILGVFTTAVPLDYQGPDEQKVDVCFVTCGPPSERQAHLRLLSGIARLSLETSLLENLRAAETETEIARAVERCAQALVALEGDLSTRRETAADRAEASSRS